MKKRAVVASEEVCGREGEWESVCLSERGEPCRAVCVKEGGHG